MRLQMRVSKQDLRGRADVFAQPPSLESTPGGRRFTTAARYIRELASFQLVVHRRCPASLLVASVAEHRGSNFAQGHHDFCCARPGMGFGCIRSA